MTLTMAEVEAAALELPLDERARLAERLLASLEEDDAADEPWADEAALRVDAFRRGEPGSVSGEQAAGEIRAPLGT